MACTQTSNASVLRGVMPKISTWDNPGNECVIVPGKIGDLGTKRFITPDNVEFVQNGVTVREFNHRALRLPQKRPFLGPEFFNSGCATLYGTVGYDTNMADVNPAVTANMFNNVFASQGFFEGNNPAPCCTGVKAASSNSALGYARDDKGQLLWTKNNNCSNYY